jgi:XTP/dITP diphosphohydrolase
MTASDPLAAFREDMRRLRAECAWKREQTHESLRRYLVEESWETLEAIDSGDPDHLREELGDLLLQIGFHAVIAEERGEFTFDEVVQGIVDKLRRRNPHVFAPDGDRVPVTDAASVNELWESVKAVEKERTSDEIGDRLLALVAEARTAGVDPEHALRDAVRRVAP